MTINFDTFKRAELRPSDVAKLLSVSRVAASLWFNGHSQPHHLIVKRVDRLQQAVASALLSKELPVSKDVPRAKRSDEIHSVISLHLSKLGLAPIEA